MFGTNRERLWFERTGTMSPARTMDTPSWSEKCRILTTSGRADEDNRLLDRRQGSDGPNAWPGSRVPTHASEPNNALDILIYASGYLLNNPSKKIIATQW